MTTAYTTPDKALALATRHERVGFTITAATIRYWVDKATSAEAAKSAPCAACQGRGRRYPFAPAGSAMAGVPCPICGGKGTA